MSPRRSTLVIAAVLALGGAGWLAWRATEMPALPAHASATASGPSSSASEPSPRALLAAAKAQVRGVAAAGCSVRLAGWTTRAASEASGVEDSEAVRRAPGYDAFRASIARIDDALRSDADPYAQAVGIWLNLPRRDGDESAVPEAERMRLLTALAMSSNDPRIHALAFGACHDSKENGCYALSARRWAEADAGNAVPWEHALHEATAASDVSGQEEALFHMAQATRADQRNRTPVAAIAAAADRAGGDATATYALSVMAIGISASQFEPIGDVSSHCREKARGDANRLQLCSRIADLLFEHSDDLEGRMLGAAITRRLTDDKARTDQAGAEIATESALFRDPMPSTCERLRQRNDWMREVALHGSQAALRALAAASPASGVTSPSPPRGSADPASSRR